MSHSLSGFLKPNSNFFFLIDIMFINKTYIVFIFTLGCTFLTHLISKGKTYSLMSNDGMSVRVMYQCFKVINRDRRHRYMVRNENENFTP